MTECPPEDHDSVRRTCDVDEALRLLAAPRRRQLVALLDAREEDRIALETLQRRLAARVDLPESDDWLLRLHHVHLPMVADAGLLEYDSHERTIRYEGCELVSDLLAAIESTNASR